MIADGRGYAYYLYELALVKVDPENEHLLEETRERLGEEGRDYPVGVVNVRDLPC